MENSSKTNRVNLNQSQVQNLNCLDFECGLLVNDRYQVVRLLAKGGFGQTYIVEDRDEMAKTQKVLKILQQNLATEIKLFEREAFLLRQLRHIGLPKYYEYFEFVPEGAIEPLYCLVMELIEGQTLADWMAESGHQPISQKQAIIWLKEIIEILQELHHNPDYPCFHRDIKPPNIMLRNQPVNGKELVLIDLGCAREITDTFMVNLAAGKQGTGIISIGYTPIEQIQGKGVPQSDFYALGCTFIYLLTGKEPKDLASEPNTGKLLWRHETKQVSPQLADLIDYMTASLWGQRPKNTEEILQRLQLIELESLSLINPSYVTQTNHEITPVKSSSIKPKQIVLIKPQPQKKKFKLGLLGFLIFTVLGWWQLPKMAIAINQEGARQERQDNLDMAIILYKLAHFINPKNVDANVNLGSIYDDKQNWEFAAKHYDLALAYTNDSTAYNNRARIFILKDKNYPKAISLLHKGLQSASNDKEKYSLWKNLGWAYLELGQLSEAKNYLSQAVEASGTKFSAYCLRAEVREKLRDQKNALVDWQKCDKFSRDAKTINSEEISWLNQAKQKLIEKEEPLTNIQTIGR